VPLWWEKGAYQAVRHSEARLWEDHTSWGWEADVAVGGDDPKIASVGENTL